MKAEVAVMLILPLVLVAVILQFLPLITRQGIFFSATVDPEFPRSADGRRLLRSYRWQAALWAIIATGLAILLLPHEPAYSVLLPMFLIIIGSSLSYWRKFREIHERYGQRRPEIRQAELSVNPTHAKFNAWVWIPPFVALALTALYLQLHWNQLPERFPVHWGADGQPNRWSSREPLTVFAPVLIGTGMNLFMLGLAWLFSQLPRNTIMRRITVRLIEVLLYPLTLTFVIVALLPLGLVVPMWLIPAVLLTCVAGLIFWSYRQVAKPLLADAVLDPQSDSYWKAGMFYYNPNDPVIFVAKRVGIGYTLNFANKMCWFVLAGILLLALLPAALGVLVAKK
jgi:uncharacterized membrane protein